MAQFRPTCPLCFQFDGYVIPLEEKNGIYICKRKPMEHRFIVGEDGYLRRVNPEEESR